MRLRVNRNRYAGVRRGISEWRSMVNAGRPAYTGKSNGASAPGHFNYRVGTGLRKHFLRFRHL